MHMFLLTVQLCIMLVAHQHSNTSLRQTSVKARQAPPLIGVLPVDVAEQGHAADAAWLGVLHFHQEPWRSI